MVKTTQLVFSGIIIAISVGAISLLLTESSIPVFTVREIMEHPNSESFLDRKIQLIGTVADVNRTGFYILDPDDPTNLSLMIYVNSTNVGKPNGFEPGKNVLVEGKLISTSGLWLFRANMISTKCPREYSNS
ncbi:MAG: cytochrome c maturation protein CcmE [Candidatus Heimdallarchaeota archaeon]